MSENIHKLALKHLFIIVFFITTVFSSGVFGQKQNTSEAVEELKKSGQYDSLMDAYKKTKGSESPTQDAVGQMKKLLASDGAANDRFGQSVAISGDTAVIGSSNDDSLRGAAYVFVRTGTVWSQQQKLTASDGAAGDGFGTSVAINGNTIVVGSPFDAIDSAGDQKGSVYVFTQVSGSWIEQTKLFASDRENNDRFGTSVALNSSGTLVIGAEVDDIGVNTDQGSVYVYSGTGPVWFFQTKLTASDGATGDQFGGAVAIDGNTIVIGAKFANHNGNADEGLAYVYTGAGSSWSEYRLNSWQGGPNLYFGSDVAISGDLIVVGAENDYFLSTRPGSAYVFIRSAFGWNGDALLFPPLVTDNERFGGSVAISGETIIVGATQTPLPTVQGSAYVFTKVGGLWTYQQQVFASDSAFPNDFGHSVAISGINVIVGTPSARIGTNSNQGAAYAFRVLTNNWLEEAFKVAADGATEDNFGFDVAINGDTAVIGSPFDDFVGGLNRGSAYVFVRSGTSWFEVAKLSAGDGGSDDWFGYSVDIYGDTIVVGSPLDDGLQGSVFVFSNVGGVWTQQAKLVAPDGVFQRRLGWSVAISQDRVVAGAISDNILGNVNQGAAYVFVKPTSSPWAFESKLTADDGVASDQFGISVDIFSNTIVIGSPGGGFSANNAGSAYIFTRSGSTWTQQTELNASDGEPIDAFGTSVAISGNTVVVGAVADEIGGNNNQGSAYVFTGGGFSWTQQAKITDPNGGFNSRLGNDVAIDGDVVVVGSAYQFSPAADSILLFERVGTNWFLRQTITRGGTTDEFGQSVAVSGDKIVVGTPKSDAPSSAPRPSSAKSLVPTAIDQGGAYFFVNNLVPTAANVTVAGRVLTSDGRGVRNAIVTITDQNGNSRSTLASSFGHYRFEEVESGQTYVVSVRSKLYQFAPQIITPAETVTGLDFTPIP